MNKAKFQCPVCNYKWEDEAATDEPQIHPIAAFCSQECETASNDPDDSLDDWIDEVSDMAKSEQIDNGL